MNLNYLLDIKEPTAEQLTTHDNIHTLAWRVERELHKSHLKLPTIRYLTRCGLMPILQAHEQQGFADYSETFTHELVTQKRCEYEQGLTSRTKYQNFRKASFWLAEMHCTGIITFNTLPNWNYCEPSSKFAKLLQFFCDDTLQTGLLAESSVNNVKSGIRTFLFELESRGRFTLDDITLAEVNDVVTHLSKQYTGGLDWFIYCITVFLRHLYENNMTKENLSLAVPKATPPRTTFREGFTVDEIERLLAEPDRETALGKRDYAIMLLAAQTGIRACDIANIKRHDIDWRKKEINIVQQKTMKPLVIPIPLESVVAIGDYLLNARPKSDLPHIFLCHNGILRPIKRRSASAIAARHLNRAEIISDIPLHGFHSFRRSFGTRLLQNGIPFDLLRQLLGQTRIDSLKPYLSVDERGLKNCALSLIAPGKAGD